MDWMSVRYAQFCPVAKASEVFAARWTPLILRELMSGMHAFSDIHRGVPLISRAVLVARLRELEKKGIVERRPRAEGNGQEYWLTLPGEDFGAVMDALGQWGLQHTCDRIEPSDLDPALLLWGLRKRVDLNALPERRIVLRFEFSGVPASRTKFRIMWLVVEPNGVDVCVKDPGFAVDLILRGDIRDWVAVFLGRRRWRAVAGNAVKIEGDRKTAKMLETWLQLDAASSPDDAGSAPPGRFVRSR
jgi:DNA-binding HxlR family transcriptional regulator